MSVQKGTPVKSDSGSGTLFWVTRIGAHVAMIALHLAALTTVLIELFRPFPEDSHAVERLQVLDFPASYAVYGFASCVMLVLIGLLLRRLVMRDEDYYGRDRR